MWLGASHWGYPVPPCNLITGKERDAETGLDYFETRYLSGAQGRVTSPDGFNILTDAKDSDE
jgi:hypothetical protein